MDDPIQIEKFEACFRDLFARTNAQAQLIGEHQHQINKLLIENKALQEQIRHNHANHTCLRSLVTEKIFPVIAGL